MEAVTVSPKHQVVIPRRLRQSPGSRSGVRLSVIQSEGRIEPIPMRAAGPMVELDAAPHRPKT